MFGVHKLINICIYNYFFSINIESTKKLLDISESKNSHLTLLCWWSIPLKDQYRMYFSLLVSNLKHITLKLKLLNYLKKKKKIFFKYINKNKTNKLKHKKSYLYYLAGYFVVSFLGSEEVFYVEVWLRFVLALFMHKTCWPLLFSFFFLNK